MTTVSNNFNRYFARATSTVATVTTVAASTDTVITGLIVANTYSGAVVASIYVTSGGNDYYLIKNSTIPVGESLIAIGWDQKVTLKPTDALKVILGTAGQTADVTLSTLEILTV